MRLLLQAALRSTRHFGLACLTLLGLWSLVIANQCEIFSLGFMINTGSDFFTLFSPEGKKVKSKISLQEVEERWHLIDRNQDGVISKKDASFYLAHHSNRKNPLDWMMHQVAHAFDLEEKFSLVVALLVGVAPYPYKRWMRKEA